MNSRRYSIETLAYGLAFLLALFIRFLSLGHLPLTDSEAALAIQALAVAKETPVVLGPQPGYILLTSVLFYLFQSTELLARFWPALAGSLMVMAPYFYRRYMGRPAAVVLAFFIALDPGLVAISRQADGTILAVAFALLAVGLYLERAGIWAGVFGGLALLGGTYLWPGIAVAALAWTLSGGISSRSVEQVDVDDGEEVIAEGASQRHYSGDMRLGWIALVLTLLVAGTLFLRVPAGLSAATGSLATYLRQWGDLSSASPLLLLAALFFYQPLGLALGLWGLVVGVIKRERVDRFLAIAWGIALLLALAYPARQVNDLAWSLLPMWALAARQAARLLGWQIGENGLKTDRLRLNAKGEMEDPLTNDFLPALAQAVLAVILLGFGWMNVTAVFSSGQSNIEPQIRLIAVLGALILLLLTSLLLGIGWSWQAMRTGLIWGVGIVLLVYSASALWSASGMGRAPAMELYRSGPAVQEEDLLKQTVGDLGMWHNGSRTIIDVAVVGVTSPALQWALRGINHVEVSDSLSTQSQPSIVITQEQKTLEAGSSYRGQDFAWNEVPTWNQLLDVEWVRWMLTRVAPVEKTTLVLWARSDLFYGETPKIEPIQP